MHRLTATRQRVTRVQTLVPQMTEGDGWGGGGSTSAEPGLSAVPLGVQTDRQTH